MKNFIEHPTLDHNNKMIASFSNSKPLLAGAGGVLLASSLLLPRKEILKSLKTHCINLFNSRIKGRFEAIRKLKLLQESVKIKQKKRELSKFKEIDFRNELKFTQADENDVANIVLMHLPGEELAKSLLHPQAGLFRNAFDIEKARKEHLAYQNTLMSHGAKVITIEEVLLEGTIDEHGNKVEGESLENLRKLAFEALTYDTSELSEAIQKLVEELPKILEKYSEDKRELLLEDFKNQIKLVKTQCLDSYQQNYKDKVIRNLSPKDLIKIILKQNYLKIKLNWYIDDSKFIVYFTADSNEAPLSNLYFLRDQLITTNKGIIINRMETLQRAPEAKVIKYALRKLNIPVIYEIKEPGMLEGGDFLPAGDIVFQGQGLRTNEDAIKQLLDEDAYGSNEVVVVKDLNDQIMDHLHLDMVFSIFAPKKVLILEDILTEHHMRRVVDVYRREETNKESKSLSRKAIYKKVVEEMGLAEYLNSIGYEIFTCTKEEQQNFAINFLNIGNNTIITPYRDVTGLYENIRKKTGVSFLYQDFSNLREGYGACHCTTQVISRRKEIRI